MAKRKSSYWQKVTSVRPTGLVLMPHGLMDVPPPSMDEVRAFITTLRPCVTLTHTLVTEGKVSEAAYHEALRTGMTHFNVNTRKFTQQISNGRLI